MDEVGFQELWEHYTTAKFDPLKPKEKHCIYAEHFAVWADALYREEAERPTHVGVNQKMLLLLKKYFEWRSSVPKAHRDCISSRSHVCLFHIFDRTYHRLKVLELSLTPPMLFLPPPPPPPRAPVVHTIAGITLGEVLDDGN